MCTAHFRWLFLDSHQMSAPVGSGGGGYEVNKFEQVSSDGHQMSLAGKGFLYSKVPCLEGGQGQDWGWGLGPSGSLYNEVQFIRVVWWN